MKVLMIGAGRDVKGGVSTVVNQYYEAHLDEKTDLKYIATMRDGGKLRKGLVAAKALAEFRSCINDYDIVHVHMASRASFYRKSQFIKMAKKHGKKIIIHMHGAQFDIFYDNECNERQKKWVRDIFSLADAVIALSEEWKEFLSKICDPQKIIVLYNSVKIPEFHRENYDDGKVLFLGRLGKRKGTYDLISAISEIAKRVPQVHFYFGGDGEIGKCKEMCVQQGIQNNVTFLGWVSGEEKEKWLQESSTYVLPSYNEGMPMSLLEAMSYGDVVISTRVGGISKVIENKSNGYLFNAGDVQELIEIMTEALTFESRKEVGEKAYMTIKNKFNIENNIASLLELYESVLRGGVFLK